MNWEEIEKNWKQFERMFNYRWKMLTKDDLKQIDGNRITLSDKLQGHYGQSKSEADDHIKKFLGTFQGILRGKTVNSSAQKDQVSETKSAV